VSRPHHGPQDKKARLLFEAQRLQHQEQLRDQRGQQQDALEEQAREVEAAMDVCFSESNLLIARADRLKK